MLIWAILSSGPHLDNHRMPESHRSIVGGGQRGCRWNTNRDTIMSVIVGRLRRKNGKTRIGSISDINADMERL